MQAGKVEESQSEVRINEVYVREMCDNEVCKSISLWVSKLKISIYIIFLHFLSGGCVMYDCVFFFLIQAYTDSGEWMTVDGNSCWELQSHIWVFNGCQFFIEREREREREREGDRECTSIPA